MIHGVLVVDKPEGITSHDVVATARRALHESRIGHTGTLDPLATGVLPLAIGRATRLVQFLAASDKDYTARIRLGLTTDTYDVTGREVARSDAHVTPEAVARELETMKGSYLQAPPPYSAKKVANRRAYDLARAGNPVQPAAVAVSVRRLQLVGLDAGIATVEVTCSAGFYVRSLAHDLGQRLGIGACLAALRRTRSGEFSLDQAVTVSVLAGTPADAATRVLPIERLLPFLPAVTVTAEGEKRVSHGREVDPIHLTGQLPGSSDWVRLMSPTGTLLALAKPHGTVGSLHPSVVLI
jgi:tRNA pseudouridine55 synthase